MCILVGSRNLTEVLEIANVDEIMLYILCPYILSGIYLSSLVSSVTRETIENEDYVEWGNLEYYNWLVFKW